MKEPGKIVIWPCHIDSTRTRSGGRKIGKSRCISAPKLDELQQAASKLALNHSVVENKAYPNSWWEKTGYVVVFRGEKGRTELLKGLATEIVRIRSFRKEKSS